MCSAVQQAEKSEALYNSLPPLSKAFISELANLYIFASNPQTPRSLGFFLPPNATAGIRTHTSKVAPALFF